MLSKNLLKQDSLPRSYRGALGAVGADAPTYPVFPAASKGGKATEESLLLELRCYAQNDSRRSVQDHSNKGERFDHNDKDNWREVTYH